MQIVRTTKRCVLITVIVVLAIGAGQARGDDDRFARTASDSITPFLVVGEAGLLLTGKHEAVQGAKALIATGLATELLKVTVRDKRPNSDSRDSFPSGHTSAAFAMATVLADYEPQYKWPAYAVASTIGWSRVEVHSHRWDDVIAGAALGYFTARHFTAERFSASPRGISYRWQW
jgi:membrane-associated phospholipid phosphatase